MYETLAMLKPDALFTVEDLHALVTDVVRTGTATGERAGRRIQVTAGNSALNMDWDDAVHVVEESNEIADRFGVPSRGSRVRVDFAGDDPEMELFNHYLMICERLHETGQFIIFDTQECKLMFA